MIFWKSVWTWPFSSDHISGGLSGEAVQDSVGFFVLFFLVGGRVLGEEGRGEGGEERGEEGGGERGGEGERKEKMERGREGGREKEMLY